MSTDTDTGTWFDRLYAEYHARGLVMFAFSKQQVEEAFEGDLAVTYEQVQQEWASMGAGLIVKRTVLKEFSDRMDADLDAWEAGQPLVHVQHFGTDYWDRPLYRVTSHATGAPVRVGQVLADASLSPAGTARFLHSITPQGEPERELNIHVVHVPKED